MDEQGGIQVPMAAPTPQRGGFAKLIGMFFEPTSVLRELTVKPTWVWPVLVVVVFAVALQLLTAPRLDMEGTIREGLERFGQADKVSAEQIRDMAANRGPIQQVGGTIGVALVIPIVSLVLAALYLLGLRVAGSDAGFGSVFSLFVHAAAPPAIVKTVLTAIIAMGRESFTAMERETLVRSSLGTWLGPDAPKPLVALGGVLDLFNLWHCVLLVLGLCIVGRVKRSAAITMVAVLWGLYALGAVGFSLLF